MMMVNQVITRINVHHGNPQPSFLGVITHILGVENLHFSCFWGPRACDIQKKRNLVVNMDGSHSHHQVMALQQNGVPTRNKGEK